MSERRASHRLETNLSIRWEGVSAQHEGSLVDISATGCFLLTHDNVQPEELVRLEIGLPGGKLIFLWGQVVYKIPEMGFALRFTGSDEAEAKMLEELLDYTHANQGRQLRSNNQASQEKTPRREQRKKTRHSIPIEVTLDVLDHNLEVCARELTVTENISPRGAAVLTALSLEVGAYLRITSVRDQISIKAIVRTKRTGEDGIRRLHLEFLDGEWPLE